MAFQRTKGLIYRIKNFKDADKIIWIFTPKHGKISCIAKGVRKLTSRRGGHIDLFNLCEFGLNKASGMHTVNEVKIINDFNDLKKFGTYTLFYLAELIDKSPIEDDNSSIFKPLQTFLELANEDNLNYLVASFELHLLKILGFAPNLDNFLDNNQKFSADASFYISYGGVGYDNQGSPDLEVGINVIKAQRFYLSHPINATMTLKIDEQTLKQMNFANKIWIQNSFEAKFKSLQFLQQ